MDVKIFEPDNGDIDLVVDGELFCGGVFLTTLSL